MFWGKVAGLAAMAAAIAVVVVPSAGAATRICAAPGSRDWERARPGELGLDPAKLKEALDFGDSRLSTSVLLIRRGCLAGVSRNGQVNYNTPQESFSMAKSTVALVAMRAMTLGLLSPEDRVGALIEEADAAHGDITIRQLLEMSSGLHWNFFADYGNVFNPDGVRGALLLPFDSKPGTEFEYHQAGVSLLTEAIERAVDEPFQDFVQRELFTPIGISRAQWTWDRDNVGNTRGFWGLKTSAANFGRLGLLMLRNGQMERQPADRPVVRGSGAFALGHEPRLRLAVLAQRPGWVHRRNVCRAAQRSASRPARPADGRVRDERAARPAGRDHPQPRHRLRADRPALL